MADQDRDARLVRIDDLRRCLATAFERLRLTPEDAAGLSGLLVESELRGHPDHGVAALGVLAGFYRDGTLNPRPRVRVLRETDGAILFDGDRGAGPGVPMRAMRWCIERARERKGMAVAAVRDWQLLVAAPYARLAAEAGLIGFACTNFVPLVAPPGGRTAVFGTNPFAYGLPALRHHPVVLDVATTVSSMQRVRVAAQQGTSMPEGVIFDDAGRPITDPRAFLEGGLLAPLGTPHAPHKGFGLALFIDALSGVLSGAGFAQGVAGGAAREFPVGSRRGGVPATAGVPGADGCTARPGQAGRAATGRPGAAGPWRAWPATVPGPHRPRRRAAGASELAALGSGVRVAGRPTACRPRHLIHGLLPLLHLSHRGRSDSTTVSVTRSARLKHAGLMTMC